MTSIIQTNIPRMQRLANVGLSRFNKIVPNEFKVTTYHSASITETKIYAPETGFRAVFSSNTLDIVNSLIKIPLLVMVLFIVMFYVLARNTFRFFLKYIEASIYTYYSVKEDLYNQGKLT